MSDTENLERTRKSFFTPGLVIVGIVVVVVTVIVVIVGALTNWFGLTKKSDDDTTPDTTTTTPDTTTTTPDTTTTTPAPPFSGPLTGIIFGDNNTVIKKNGYVVFNSCGATASEDGTFPECLDANKITWDQPHNITIPDVTVGDMITFSVKNTGGPGGFAGSFTWNNTVYNVDETTFPGFNTFPSTPTWPWLPWTAANILSAIWDKDNCNICTIEFNWIAPAAGKIPETSTDTTTDPAT